MWHHFEHVFANVFAPVILVILAITIVVLILVKLTSKPTEAGWPVIILAFSMLGGVTGVYVGLSKSPVVGSVLPAVLTFITGLLAYLFGKEELKTWRPVIPGCVVALMATVLFGTFLGNQVRLENQNAEKKYKRWLLHYENVLLPVAKEGYLMLLKNSTPDPNKFDPLLKLQKLEKQKEEEQGK